ncbi:MAG TPA: hypothetical protein VG603_06785 [Chitinophagales bacterium]|nr:hypothetical protein [Chitinophagales bacterium]
MSHYSDNDDAFKQMMEPGRLKLNNPAFETALMEKIMQAGARRVIQRRVLSYTAFAGGVIFLLVAVLLVKPVIPSLPAISIIHGQTLLLCLQQLGRAAMGVLPFIELFSALFIINWLIGSRLETA